MVGGWYEDTNPRALEVMLDLYRKMTPGERLARVFDLCAFQESLQRASVKSMFPDAQ